jgi:hypothetical protein
LGPKKSSPKVEILARGHLKGAKKSRGWSGRGKMKGGQIRGVDAEGGIRGGGVGGVDDDWYSKGCCGPDTSCDKKFNIVLLFRKDLLFRVISFCFIPFCNMK